MLWAQEFPELCWLLALPAPFLDLLECVTAQGQTGAVTNHYSSCFCRAAPIPGRALGSAGHQEPAHAPWDFPARVLCGAEAMAWAGCLLELEETPLPHQILPQHSFPTGFALISTQKAAGKVGFAQKRTLVSASGGAGSSLGKGLLPPFYQLLSQTQSPTAFTLPEGWDAPAVPHAHPRAQTEPRVWLRTGGAVQGWTIPTLLFASVTLDKPCRAQLEAVLEGLGCPPKPGDPVQRGVKALGQAPAPNPWPAPPARSCPLTLHKQTITYNVRENNLTPNH